MSLSLTINGVTFEYPQTGDTDWGNQATLWANAVSTGLLQKAGGSFELTDDVDFGPNFGLYSLYFSSRGNQPSSVGVLRLTFQDAVSWRNNTGDNNVQLGINSQDLVSVDGVPLLRRPTVFDGPGDVTLSSTNYGAIVLAQTTAAPITVTLPTPVQGLSFTIKDGQGNANSNNVTIDPGAFTIDGASGALTISTNWGWYTLTATNGAYFIVGAS